MSRNIFLLFSFFWCVFMTTLLGGTPQYQYALRSKQFDCTYLFRHDMEERKTMIDIRFDGQETRFMQKQPKSYDISEIITESTLIKEGTFESLICKTQQGNLFYIILKEEPVIQPIIIAPILEQLIPEIKNTEYLCDISSFAAGDEQLYLALSITTENQKTPLRFLAAFFINYHPKTGFLMIPLAVKKIEQDCVIHKIQFDHDFKRLFCVGSTGLLCTHLQSGTIEMNQQQKTIHDIVIAPEWYLNNNPTAKTISLDDVVFMTTSSALSYIVLHSKTKNSICVVPVSADNMIASQDAIIDDIFYLDGIKHFLYRRLLGNAPFCEITWDENNHAVSVETSDIGTIQKVKVYGDSIVILTEKTNQSEKKSYCVYKSTALFHANGLIKDWTRWQMVHKTKTPMIDFEFDRIRGEFIMLYQDRVAYSGWNPKKQYKPHNRFEDACITPLILHEKEIDFFAAISGNTFFFGPLETALCDSETLQKKEIPGSMLQHVHLCVDPITQKPYCFLSSDDGLIEVVIDNDGIITTIKKPVHAIKNVKKVIVDQEYSYILAEKALYRSKKNDDAVFDSNNAKNILDPLLQNQYGTLLDMIVSDSFVLLSSTRGLWSIKPGYSLLHNDTIVCEKIQLPHSVGFPAKLYVLSKDGVPHNVARYQGGNIHVLCVDYSLKRSQLYRFSVTPIEGEKVSEHTVQLFEDIILYKTRAPFINFGSLQHDCFFDGIRYLLLSSQQQLSLSMFPRLGKIMSGNNLVAIPQRDFQSERILYTGMSKHGALIIISEHGIYCYE